MTSHPTLLRQTSVTKPMRSNLTNPGTPVSWWQHALTRLRQEPLAVVLLVWGVLFLLAWLYFTWLG